ncbi:MAG: hypothetical protein HC854_16465 [Flavobacterium sp.]|nr:hypothetical protein [Flavobacterium sp.]
MKNIKYIILLLSGIIVTSCATVVPLNKEFYNTKKVGVILQIDSIRMAKSGSQGLLDMALTPGNRFTEPLKKVEPKLNINEIIKNEITYILNKRNKQFEYLTEKIDFKSLNNFEKPNSKKKYSKKDYRHLKKTNDVDEILLVNVNYGILVSYYGVIETGKNGYVNIRSQIIDLSDNSLLQNDNVMTTSKIIGNWKEGEDYSNLKNSNEEAITNSTILLKTKFLN